MQRKRGKGTLLKKATNPLPLCLTNCGSPYLAQFQKFRRQRALRSRDASILLVSAVMRDEESCSDRSSTKRRRLELLENAQQTSMEAAGSHVPATLLCLTTVSGIADEFNAGAVSFKDLVSGDWNSAVFANCKYQSIMLP